MTLKKKAEDIAIEILEELLEKNWRLLGQLMLVEEERDVLKAAMAQPEQINADIADILAGELQISRATAYDLRREALAKAQPEQVKPWVGLTDEENHIAEVLNKTLGLQYVADKLQEKNT